VSTRSARIANERTKFSGLELSYVLRLGQPRSKKQGRDCSRPARDFATVTDRRYNFSTRHAAHVAHAAAVAATARCRLVLLRQVGDEAFGREQHPAMDAAFCSAERVTFFGSTMPAFTRSSYSPVATL